MVNINVPMSIQLPKINFNQLSSVDINNINPNDFNYNNICQPTIRWIYTSEDGKDLEGKTGSLKNGDPFPKGKVNPDINPNVTTTVLASSIVWSLQSYYYGWGDVVSNANQGDKALGDGQTIVIVNRFGSKYAAQDLQTFAAQFPSKSAPKLQIINLEDIYPSLGKFDWDYFKNSNDQKLKREAAGWAQETSLDLQAAWMMAPKANIILVVTPYASGFDTGILGMQYAINNLSAKNISCSWGYDEGTLIALNKSSIQNTLPVLFFDDNNTMRFAALSGIEFVRYFEHFVFEKRICSYTVATGDKGGQLMYPASSPNSLAIGGTQFYNTYENNVLNGLFTETLWSHAACGVTNFFNRPPYQDSFNLNTRRSVPDISYNSGTNVQIFFTNPFNALGTGTYIYTAGTSAATPQIASFLAVLKATNSITALNDPTIKNLFYGNARSNYSLYFNDIKTGTTANEGYQSQSAANGFDVATGLGSPKINKFVTFIPPTPTPTKTPIPTKTPTPTPTKTKTPIPTPTKTKTPTPTKRR
jgi:hypothetical protein